MRKGLAVKRGAIFDQDGLLFDTEVIFERSWRQAGAEMGFAVGEALTHAACGCGKRELAAAISPHIPSGVDVDAYIARALTLSAETQMRLVPACKPGVREILAYCRDHGIKTAIASSSMRHLVDHNLSSTQLEGCFDAIVTGGDVANGKPAPDIFLLAAERLGLRPTDCVVFEDAFSGIRAAHAAGCRPVLIPDRLQPTAEILGLCVCHPTLAAAIPTVFD